MKFSLDFIGNHLYKDKIIRWKRVAAETVAWRNDLDVFGCGWPLKIEWAERFMFLQAQMSSNRSKFSAEREGKEPGRFPRL